MHDQLLAGIPDGLRDELVQEYNSLFSSYVKGSWKYSSLDAGRFCEVAYSVLVGAVTGDYPESASKPKDMVAACRLLENNAKLDVGDRSLRILLPRAIPAVYEIRNNRNVGHVGGDVAPNKIDATYTLESCRYILAELVRVFHNCDIQEAQDAVDSLADRPTPLVWEMGDVVRVLSTEMTHKDKALVLLHHAGRWIKTSELAKWGKYKLLPQYRSRILKPLDREMLIEFDSDKDLAHITPIGIDRVVEHLL
ncbi:MAG: hypothetical protein R3B67_00640 [Phycisphaerales bacterium]